MEKETWEDGTGNYLKIRGEGEETLADRMFMYQDIPGFLPMEITWINGRKEYIYDISGKVSLSQYLTEHEITKKELKDILKQIMNLCDLVQEYLLEGNKVVCQEDYIYIDQRTGEISGIYQEKSPHGGVTAVGALLEFIMKKMNAKDEALAFFVYGLHKLTKEAGMTRQLLRDYIERDMEENKNEETDISYKKIEGRQRYERAVSDREKTLQKSEMVSIFGGKLRSYVLPVSLLGAGVLLTLVAWYSGWFRQPLSQRSDMMMGIGASVFFIGVAGYGAWRIWPKKVTYDVLWREEEQPKKACLISCHGKSGSIPIAYYPFVLGSEEESADGVIPAAGIDQIHARIQCEGSELYILDEESEQGTYHNDERLVPWHKKRLRDGDILRLAETEYVVEIS